MINFEFLEIIFFDDYNGDMISVVNKIKLMGIGIEFDDFGIGYVLFMSFMKVWLNWLKIDWGLILFILDFDDYRMIVGLIIDVVKKLGVEVVVEGIECVD